MREAREADSASEPVVDLAAVMLGGAGWLMVIQMPISIPAILVLRPTEELSQASTGQIALAFAVLILAAIAMLGSARVLAERRRIWMPVVAMAWLGCGSLLVAHAHWTSSGASALPGTIWGGLMIALSAYTCFRSIQRRRRRRTEAATR